MILVWVARTLDPEQQDGEMADLHSMHALNAARASLEVSLHAMAALLGEHVGRERQL